MTSFRALCAVIISAIATAAIITSTAGPQHWPSRPMLTISPFAASSRQRPRRAHRARPSRSKCSANLSSSRTGRAAAASSASTSVVRADPDGYTYILELGVDELRVILHKSLPYYALRDLEPVAMLGAQPSVLVAARAKGFKTVPTSSPRPRPNPAR